MRAEVGSFVRALTRPHAAPFVQQRCSGPPQRGGRVRLRVYAAVPPLQRETAAPLLPAGPQGRTERGHRRVGGGSSDHRRFAGLSHIFSPSVQMLDTRWPCSFCTRSGSTCPRSTSCWISSKLRQLSRGRPSLSEWTCAIVGCSTTSHQQGHGLQF